MRTRKSLFALAMLIAAVSTFDSASAGFYSGGDFYFFGFDY